MTLSRIGVERADEYGENAQSVHLVRGAQASSVELVPLDLLLPGDSPRFGGEDDQHVSILAEVAGDLPPILAHRPTMRVIDGMHRLKVAHLRGVTHIEVRFFDGSSADAFVLAVEANTFHGLPLTRQDRVNATTRIIASHPHWSDRMISAKVGLSDKSVASIRRCSSADIPQTNRRIGRDGRTRPANAADGRRQAAEYLARKPDATLRELAAVSGIAIATARDVRQRVQSGQDPVPARRIGGLERVHHVPVQRGARPIEGFDLQSESAAVMAALGRLRNDPSLRFTEAGRVILRLLDVHSMDASNWVRLVDQVPSHCVESVAEAAAHCAEVLRNVVQQLRQRSTEM